MTTEKKEEYPTVTTSDFCVKSAGVGQSTESEVQRHRLSPQSRRGVQVGHDRIRHKDPPFYSPRLDGQDPGSQSLEDRLVQDQIPDSPSVS